MRKILLTFSMVIACILVQAQYYYVPYLNEGRNPGNLNTDGENPASLLTGWSNIWSGPASSAVAYSSNINLPFTFSFDGTYVTSYKACNAGFVTFDVGATYKPAGFSNLTLPNASIPDMSVCVLGMKPISNSTYQSTIVTKTFGTAPNRQHWIQFNFFSEANIQNGWTYWAVVLEETTNNIYIVDMKTLCVTSGGQLCTSNVKMSAGIQTDATTAYTIAGSPNVAAQNIATNLFNASDNSYYKFSEGNQPVTDVEGYKGQMPEFLALTQTPFSVKGIFKNVGSAAISNCDINYSINNGPAVTAPATVSIAKYATASVTSTATWTPSATGTYKVTVWLSNINGNVDEKGLNDSITQTVTVLDDFVVRVPLHEVFTSSTCGPCAPGNRNIDNVIFPQFPNQYSVIKYQMSWPGTGDPYTTAEGNTRRTLYGVNSIPNMQVDGGWNGNAGSYTSALFNQFAGKPSFIKIESSHVINFKKVTVDVKLTPLADYNNANMKLFVALVEKRTVKNVKSNGETEFFHVLKKMLPNASGTNVGALTKGVDKTFPQMVYNVPGNYRLPTDGQTANIINLATENSIEDLQNCDVVVFVQDLTTKEVYQSANSSGTVLSVDDLNASEDVIMVYPNPVSGDFTNIRFSINQTENAKVTIYNAFGQVVDTIDSDMLEAGVNTLKINTSSYSTGIYTVKIEGGNYAVTEKFIVH